MLGKMMLKSLFACGIAFVAASTASEVNPKDAAANARTFDPDALQSLDKSDTSHRPQLSAFAILFNVTDLEPAMAIADLPFLSRNAAALALIKPPAESVSDKGEYFHLMAENNGQLLDALTDTALEEAAIYALLQDQAPGRFTFADLATISKESLASAASTVFAPLSTAKQSAYKAAETHGVFPTMQTDLQPAPSPQEKAKGLESASVVVAAQSAADFAAHQGRSVSTSTSVMAPVLVSRSTQNPLVLNKPLQASAAGPRRRSELDAMASSILQKKHEPIRSAVPVTTGFVKRNASPTPSTRLANMERGAPTSMSRRQLVDDIVLPTVSPVSTTFPVISQAPRPIEPGMMAQTFDPLSPSQKAAIRAKGAGALAATSKESSASRRDVLGKGLLKMIGAGILLCLCLGSVLCVIL